MTTSAPSVTVSHNDHAAAAAYLMKHAGMTALAVLDGQWTGRVIGIITQDDISQAISAGLDLNDVRIRDVMTEARSREAARSVPGVAAAARSA